jgi:hypothetical protein
MVRRASDAGSPMTGRSNLAGSPAQARTLADLCKRLQDGWGAALVRR